MKTEWPIEVQKKVLIPSSQAEEIKTSQRKSIKLNFIYSSTYQLFFLQHIFPLLPYVNTILIMGVH